MAQGDPHQRSAVREYFSVLAFAAQSAEGESAMTGPRRPWIMRYKTPQARDNEITPRPRTMKSPIGHRK